ncbi:MAG TPA: HupE/UreJ family protein [Opitutaceae bacterium]|nr:HupE/UreJ family protein [Opitutaceae bacterium]
MKNRLVALLVFLAAGIGALRAHELQPAYLELRQTGPETFHVLWKVPPRDDLAHGIRPQLPENSRINGEPIRQQTSTAYTERFVITCPGGLAGQTIGVTGSMAALADVLVRIQRLDGTTQITRLTPSVRSFVVTAAPNRWQMAGTFFRLGLEHILMGVDHLLFVLGLLLLVQDRWMLLKTITSFTVAHSITLAIATLGYASAPLPPLNAAIALSILFLGPEIIARRRGETSFTLRHPWVVAFAFGLLHGFGFASGLANTGLSPAEIPPALLLFNVGVEAGQLFFVLIILLLERSFRLLEIRWTRWAELLPAYAIGALGTYWTIQRTVIMCKDLL